MFFCGKVVFLEVKQFHGLHDDLKKIRKIFYPRAAIFRFKKRRDQFLTKILICFKES